MSLMLLEVVAMHMLIIKHMEHMLMEHMLMDNHFPHLIVGNKGFYQSISKNGLYC
jgi:hypothetical protein